MGCTAGKAEAQEQPKASRWQLGQLGLSLALLPAPVSHCGRSCSLVLCPVPAFSVHQSRACCRYGPVRKAGDVQVTSLVRCVWALDGSKTRIKTKTKRKTKTMTETMTKTKTKTETETKTKTKTGTRTRTRTETSVRLRYSHVLQRKWTSHCSSYGPEVDYRIRYLPFEIRGKKAKTLFT